MTALIAFLSILFFLIAFAAAGIVPLAGQAVTVATSAGRVMADPALDDTAKEASVRRAGLALLRLFAGIFGRSLLALGAAALPIWLGDLLGLAAAAETFGFLERWEVIVGASLATTAAVLAAGRAWRA